MAMPTEAQASTEVDPGEDSTEAGVATTTKVAHALRAQTGLQETAAVQRAALATDPTIGNDPDINPLRQCLTSATVAAIPDMNANHVGLSRPTVEIAGKKGTSLRCAANPRSKRQHQGVMHLISKAPFGASQQLL